MRVCCYCFYLSEFFSLEQVALTGWPWVYKDTCVMGGFAFLCS